MKLEPRTVIATTLGEGIVMARAASPSASWLREQVDERVRAMPASTAWWRVFPLRGGALLVPEPLARPLREATYDDFLTAVDHGNDHARRALAELFPDYTARARESLGRAPE